MLYRINVSSFSEKDLHESFSFYEEIKAGLGKIFIICINSSFKIIAENPMAFPVVYKSIRRFVVRKFPFLIYYLNNPKENETLVIAVLHSKRNPNIFKKRNYK
jgi:toxin ParE1/3/4